MPSMTRIVPFLICVAAITQTAIAQEKPAKPKRIELLPMIDLSQHMVGGQWAIVDGALVGGGVNASRVQIPYAPPEEYDVRVKARMTKPGSGRLQIGLIAEKQQFYVAI